MVMQEISGFAVTLGNSVVAIAVAMIRLFVSHPHAVQVTRMATMLMEQLIHACTVRKLGMMNVLLWCLMVIWYDMFFLRVYSHVLSAWWMANVLHHL